MSLKIDATALQHAMVDAGLNQQELAERSGVTASTIYRISKGQAFNSTTLDAIANALGRDPLTLVKVAQPAGQ